MIDKELIELQRGCKATCVVIENKDLRLLEPSIIISSNGDDRESISDIKDIDYLIISEIDKIDFDTQDKYYHLIKDREYRGCKLQDNTIIVLTVNERDALKSISPKLYNLCVVAF